MVSVGRPVHVLSVLLLCAAIAPALQGCATNEDDVHRWADTLNGPRKLAAVLTHDKYPLGLRVEAAATLVTMRPRGGQYVGLQGGEEADQPGLLNALASLQPPLRTRILSALIPRLVEGMAQPVSGQSDPSIPYKDAAYGLLTHEDGALVASVEGRNALKEGLERWLLAAFDSRMDNPAQAYGMEQVVQLLGAQGVRGLPPAITPDAPKLGKIVDLIAALGDGPTKAAAGMKLVAVAQAVSAEAWLKDREPAVRKANEESKLRPTPQQLRAQLAQYQEEELLRLFGSMKKLGTAPVVTYLTELGGDPALPERRRAAALTALQGHLETNRPDQVQALLRIARDSKTPDAVRGAALERVGELPRSLVIKDLFALFREENWKVRWVAAELALKMSTMAELDEFMAELGQISDMAITEPIRYGALIGKMKPPPTAVEMAEKYAAASNPIPARLSALGYFHEYGTLADSSRVSPYATDGGRVPRCRPNADDCEWRCVVGQSDTQKVEEVTTVGQFVSYCVLPAMQRRSTKQNQPSTPGASISSAQPDSARPASAERPGTPAQPGAPAQP